jgi:RNA polymerase sigma-70 factor (ECF subfamily)
MSMAGQREDDEQLIHTAQSGDLSAFNALVLRYQNDVYNVTYRIMGDDAGASDATQDTFITVYRRLDTYRGGSFRSWLLRIATNTCYDLLRYQKRRPALGFDDLVGEDFDDGPPLPDPGVTPEQAMQDSELSAAIQECINGLHPDQRAVLVMNDIEGYSYQEIADTTAVQLGTVKSRLSRARASLRHCLQAVQELLPDEYRLVSDD